jgi:hypothetical protein
MEHSTATLSLTGRKIADPRVLSFRSSDLLFQFTDLLSGDVPGFFGPVHVGFWLLGHELHHRVGGLDSVEVAGVGFSGSLIAPK